jgi:hypothetical protein
MHSFTEEPRVQFLLIDGIVVKLHPISLGGASRGYDFDQVLADKAESGAIVCGISRREAGSDGAMKSRTSALVTIVVRASAAWKEAEAIVQGS